MKSRGGNSKMGHGGLLIFAETTHSSCSQNDLEKFECAQGWYINLWLFHGLTLDFAGGRLLLAPSMMGLTWMHDR